MAKMFFLMGCSLMAFHSLGYSQETNLQEANRESACVSHTLDVEAIYSYVHIQTEGLASFNGNMGGVGAQYQYHPVDNFYGGLRFFWKQGPTSSSEMDRTLLDLLLEERVGYTIGLNGETWWLDTLTLYTGFGLRWLSSSLKFSGATLAEDYYEYFVPVGFLTHFPVTNNFSIDCNFAWLPQVDPTVHLKPIGGARWDLAYQLSNFALEIPFTYTSCQEWAVCLTPFYEHWQDGASTASTTTGAQLGFPGNIYNFFGLTLSVSKNF